MKIELDSRLPGINFIESYSSEGIVIKENLYQDSIIVSPELLIDDWPPENLRDLAISHFHDILELSPEIILIGTGKKLQFPDNELLMTIMSANIGIEVMDTRAACRAYNLIASEGRIVIAALLGIEA